MGNVRLGHSCQEHSPGDTVGDLMVYAQGVGEGARRAGTCVHQRNPGVQRA